MKKDEAKIFVSLALALGIYALCQQDLFLPAAAFGFLLVSFSLRISCSTSRLTPGAVEGTFGIRWLQIPWFWAIALSAVLGGIWRAFLGPSSLTVSFMPRTTGILQAAAIFLTLLVWFRPVFRDRHYLLRLLAWAIAALSVNVPFTKPAAILFWFFCALNAVFILTESLKMSLREKQSAKFKRGFAFYGVVFLFAAAVYGSTRAVVWVIEASDRTFLHLVNDYALPLNPSHFISMNPFLALDGPGMSGKDIRPVLEIGRRDNAAEFYLMTQVFEDYDNGVWKIPQKNEKHPLAQATGAEVRLKMFDQFTDIIPAPQGVVAAQGKGEFLQDPNGILYNNFPSKLRKITLFVAPEKPLEDGVGDSMGSLLTISPSLKEFLSAYFARNIGTVGSPREAAQRIELFLRSHFQYTLDVNFRADDDGLMRMLRGRQPAYCSYFASAMALMLRAEGIPARVVTGFLATETVGRDMDKFLVRVRDAHAWVEAFLPVPGGGSRWARFDPTPPGSRSAALRSGENLIQFADILWRWQVNLQAELSDIDWPKVRAYIFVWVLILVGGVYLRQFWGQWIRQPKKIPAESLPKEVNTYLAQIYKRFSVLLQAMWGCQKLPAETHAELLNRLKDQPNFTVQQAAQLSLFLEQYHAARFGSKDSSSLESLIKELESSAD